MPILIIRMSILLSMEMSYKYNKLCGMRNSSKSSHVFTIAYYNDLLWHIDITEYILPLTRELGYFSGTITIGLISVKEHSLKMKCP